MFAVREEVDVLKERIGELMERINHLEYENTVLRKYATQEALQQIQQQHGGAPNPWAGGTALTPTTLITFLDRS